MRQLLLRLTKGQTVCHFFGGLSDFGVRMDLDPRTHPHVRADAYLAPFARGSFDAVILDPPYRYLSVGEKNHLLAQARFVARRHVFWFHTLWIAGGPLLRLRRAWLVRVGDQCVVRCLQDFVPRRPAVTPAFVAKRGPALRYRRWLAPQFRLPLEKSDVLAAD